MVDESLDIATTKKLIAFCKIIINNELKFCANIDVNNGTAETAYNEITEWFTNVGGNKLAAVKSSKRRCGCEAPTSKYSYNTYMVCSSKNLYPKFYVYSAPRYIKSRKLKNI